MSAIIERCIPIGLPLENGSTSIIIEGEPSSTLAFFAIFEAFAMAFLIADSLA